MSERSGKARKAEEQAPAWQAALDKLERALEDALRAVGALHDALASTTVDESPASLEERAEPSSRPELRTVVASEEDEGPSSAEVTTPAGEDLRDDDADGGEAVLSPADKSARLSAFERVWERIERERMEKETPEDEEPRAQKRGLDLLPQQYLMTVEDRENQVDLVSVHRALLTLADQQDVSLVSFANGTPVISLRVEGELDLTKLGEAVASGTNRACEVIEQGTGKLFLRLTTPQDEAEEIR